LHFFSDFFRSLQIGERGLVNLVRADGLVLAREPPNGLIGQSIAANPLFTEYLKDSPHGSYRVTVRTDGIERMVAYRTIQSPPLVVSVGVAIDDVLKEWNDDLRIFGAIWLGCSLILAACTALLVRQATHQAATERLARQHAIEASKARALLADAIENIQDGFVLYDANDRLVMINSIARDWDPNFAAVAVPGASRSEIIRAAAKTGLIGGESGDPLNDRLTGPRVTRVRTVERQVAGRWYRVTERPTGDSGLVVLRTDITALKEASVRLDEARAAAEAAAQQYRLLADNTTDMITRISHEGVRLYTSPACLQLLGYTPEEMTGRTVFDINHPDDAEISRQAIKELREGAHSREVIVRFVRKDGTTVWVETQMTAIRDANSDKPREIVTVVRNIDKRKAVEDQLALARDAAEAANRAKSEFLATMSHEIRTPMNAVIGIASLLAETQLDAQQREHIETLRSSARSLLGLLNDILDYSKIEAGRVDLEDIDFAPAALVDSTVSILTETAQQKGLVLTSEVAANVPPMVRGDQQRLRQILLNLMNNAIKFTEHGRVEVRVACSRQNDTAVELAFEVRDTGVGISEEAQSRLFHRFTQADSSVNRKYGGSGLGLSISRRLAELMGGEIGVKSVAGQGSAFWFRVVLTAADPNKVVIAAAESVVSDRKLRILLVEDVEVNRRIATLMLKAAGHTVDSVADGALAVNAVQDKSYDLVLMDIQMPGMDGYEATTRIRALDNDSKTVPIVAMTANAMQDDVRRCHEVGMNGHIAKPIEKNSLLLAVSRWASAA
jgi:PAS domain S-box-containing protein